METKKIILILMFSFSFTIVRSQFNTIFSYGCIGNNGTLKPKYSGIFLFDSTSCINVYNGLTKFKLTNPTLINLGCIENAPKIIIDFNAYPNPMRNYVILKPKREIKIVDYDKAEIFVYNNLGQLIYRIDTSISSLNAGYTINFNNAYQGILFIKVAVNKRTYSNTLKVIKTN